MSFPPPLPNSAMFQAFAQGVPPMPPFPIPMAGLPVPLVPPPGPLPMGVTVPAGVASISAPPVRKQNSGIIAAPPVMQLSNNVLMYPPPINQHMHQHPGKPYQEHGKKCQNTITVFVGNITEKASDMLIRQLLLKCGPVTHWKRVQGPNGKLQAFGFCEYCDAEAAMRAIRLLHDFEIADKKLIVRVDAKTQEKLDEYLKSKNSNSSKESKNDTDSSQNAEEELDSFTKEEDRKIKSQLILVLKEHEIELTKDLPESSANKGSKRGPSAPNNKIPNENLNELEIEDEKRNLIHREIDRFRDTYKKYDEEKEEEKKKRDDRDDRPRRRDDDRRLKRSGDRERDRDRRGDKERDRDTRRSSSPEAFNRSKSPTDEEDIAMKRRKDKITREKEVAYQRRLRDWESREKRKAKEYERESINEARNKEEEEIEKQKLKQFLQDYDDDKHDQKYYKGRNMHKRMAERRKEIVQDDCEHEQERKELEALKQKLAEEGHPDPDSEVRKRLNVAESPNSINDQIKMLMSEARNNNTIFDNDEDSHDSSNMAVKTFGFQGMKIAAGDVAPSQHPNGASASAFPLEVHNDNSNHSVPMSSSDAKRKRLMVSDVFNTIEDDEANIQNGKKRRPPPNALLEDSNTDSNLSGSSSKPVGGASSSQISQEEKRRQVKFIIDKIPTLKEELFSYSIEWDRLDNSLMEKRIQPWINKKISDYIGEEEKTLLEFICKKLKAQCSAQDLLDNVAMVLDEEASTFVVKLWRLLIYEIEAKKVGISK